MLAAMVLLPNFSRNRPHQPGGKMKSQPYWTRQVVASMGQQEICGTSCRPNGKYTCKPIWCFSRLSSSTLNVKCQVRPKAFPQKIIVWPTVAGPSGRDVLPGRPPTRHNVPIVRGSPRPAQPVPRRLQQDRLTGPWYVPPIRLRMAVRDDLRFISTLVSNHTDLQLSGARIVSGQDF